MSDSGTAPSKRAGFETDIAARLARLTTEQKVRLLTGADFWALHPEPTIGLRKLLLSDGPAGVRGTAWDERDPSLNLPSGTAIAATWDSTLVERLGTLLAGEAQRKGVHAVLAPTVNLHRSPLGGRHFECYSEDPLLSGRIGSAYVRGIQGSGVAATVKHFVANDSETERMTVNVRVDERALRELYLAPFETIVREAGVWMVMAGYNSVNGVTMTEHPGLRSILHDEWGFDGVVVSDWLANTSTVASARAALDLTMPGPMGPWGDKLVRAIRDGEVNESTVDDKVRRVLRLASRVGALENSPSTRNGASAPEDAHATLREATAEGCVLARNDHLLPLDARDLGRVAVLGQHANLPRTQGGGSASVLPTDTVSPLRALRRAFGDGTRVEYSRGARARTAPDPIPVELLRDPDTGEPGIRVDYLDAAGEPRHTEHRTTQRLTWIGSLNDAVDDVDIEMLRVRATQRVERAGTHRFAVFGAGEVELHVDERRILRGTEESSADPLEDLMLPPQRHADVEFDAGGEVVLRLDYRLGWRRQFGSIGLGWQEPGSNSDRQLDDAAALAADADVAIVVVGTTEEIESEGFDRDTLRLPGRQDELVRRTAAANSRTVVVVNGGAPVEMPWFDDVAAVLLAWFPGQEFGDALASVLTGEREPGGRMPTTWPSRSEDAPVLSTAPQAGMLDYAESIHVGYRAWQHAGRAPRLPFGHGLGYTSWEFIDLSAPVSVAAGEDVTVAVNVRNTGPRAGKQVVQVYLACPDSAIDRPVRWLAGFVVVRLEPGETTTERIRLSARAFQHWDPNDSRWRTEAAHFVVAAGTSCVELPLKAGVDVA